jgi:methyl-accepting chemotaxis protein
MPTTMVLLACSWLIAISGLFIGGFYCFSSLKIGIGIIFAGIILAAVIRVVGNIGEIIFNLNANFLSASKNTDQILSNLTQTFDNIHQNLQQINSNLTQTFDNIHQNLQQINSDSRDINQNIHNIWLLFENIKNTLEK